MDGTQVTRSDGTGMEVQAVDPAVSEVVRYLVIPLVRTLPFRRYTATRSLLQKPNQQHQPQQPAVTALSAPPLAALAAAAADEDQASSVAHQGTCEAAEEAAGVCAAVEPQAERQHGKVGDEDHVHEGERAEAVGAHDGTHAVEVVAPQQQSQPQVDDAYEEEYIRGQPYPHLRPFVKVRYFQLCTPQLAECGHAGSVRRRA
jgi:hypothetical protein